MTTDMKTCHIAKSGNIITPEGRLSFAQYLVEPQENQSGKMKYSLNLLIPNDANLSELKKAMGKIALEKCDGDKNRAKNFVERRFLDPLNLPGGGKPMDDAFKGWVLLRASSDYKPKMAYPNGSAIPDEQIRTEIYSGRWARVTINPYWSNNKENKGVFLGLQNVQLLGHDDNMGVSIPNAEDEFDAVEGAEETPSGGSEAADSDVDAMFD